MRSVKGVARIRFTALLAVLCLAGSESGAADPAGWGTDHVGKPMPEYMTGDECLFCHRAKIGSSWQSNRHQTTIRLLGADTAQARSAGGAAPLPDTVQFVLGRTNQLRFLKRSDHYGQLDLLHSPSPEPPARPDHARPGADATWEADTFGDRCAGCHATAVETQSRAFATVGIDCFACHGDVDRHHTQAPERALLARERNDPALVIISICGSCHLRSGRSRSTGRPYANQFVPGDNLFLDFEVDLSDSAIERAPAIDRHILANVRDVVQASLNAVTCLTCHLVHRGGSFKHRRLSARSSCWTCHDGAIDKLIPGWSAASGTVCGY